MPYPHEVTSPAIFIIERNVNFIATDSPSAVLRSPTEYFRHIQAGSLFRFLLALSFLFSFLEPHSVSHHVSLLQ